MAAVPAVRSRHRTPALVVLARRYRFLLRHSPGRSSRNCGFYPFHDMQNSTVKVDTGVVKMVSQDLRRMVQPPPHSTFHKDVVLVHITHRLEELVARRGQEKTSLSLH